VPLPNILGSLGFLDQTSIQPGLDLQAAFEGTSATACPEDVGTLDEGNPLSLCMSTHYTGSRESLAPETTYDIDSLCCFPSSLGFARQGIHWLPNQNAANNITHDIHFSLPVPKWDEHHARFREQATPIHKISHYCLGTVIGMESLQVLIFFPELRADLNYEASTHLTKNEFAIWYDRVLMPAIEAEVNSSNILQHLPGTAAVASIDATTLLNETHARKDTIGSRQQNLKYALQPQHLHNIWQRILRTLNQHADLSKMRNPRLFVHSKNTKLEYMTPSLSDTFAKWSQSWHAVTYPEYCSADNTFIDLGKQVTSEHNNLLNYSAPLESSLGEVYLWKDCCLNSYISTRRTTLPNRKTKRGSPSYTKYHFAATRDSSNVTLFTALNGKERKEGLVYSQFYGLIKTPFDTAKAYVFQQDSLEKLVLDTEYVRSLQQVGGAVTFSEAVLKRAYQHMKQRAAINLRDNQCRSYGVREEHRISLTMMHEIELYWAAAELHTVGASRTPIAPLPYYIVPTPELFRFLYAQINKFCFLFEYLYAYKSFGHVSTPESAVMLVALRALRFCYSSNILAKESLLYKDAWQRKREYNQREETVEIQGLGIENTIRRCGLG